MYQYDYLKITEVTKNNTPFDYTRWISILNPNNVPVIVQYNSKKLSATEALDLSKWTSIKEFKLGAKNGKTSIAITGGSGDYYIGIRFKGADRKQFVTIVKADASSNPDNQKHLLHYSE